METILRGPLREVMQSNLLVEDDQKLVQEKLQNGKIYRSSKTIMAFFGSSTLFLYLICVFCEYNDYPSLNLTLKIALNFYIVIGIYILHVLLIPFVVRICIWQFGRVDFRFHTFIAQLRQNEPVLYRLQQQIRDDTYIYAKESRLQCISELRNLIELTREYDWQIPTDIPPIEDFITDELKILADINEPVQLDHLELKALKALWQFMYLQRSETLRNFAIYHHDECVRLAKNRHWWSLIRFSRISLFNFVKFTWYVSYFDVRLEKVPVTKQSKCPIKVENQTELSILILQLEYLLERLRQIDSIENERSLITQTLLEIASSIHPKNCPKKSRNSEIDNKNVETDTNFEREIPDEYRENNEYEVYEALESDDRNFDATDDYVSYFQIDPLIERKQDLQAELKHVLNKRQKEDRELQINALAKRRNKPVDEVRKELEEEEANTSNNQRPAIQRSLASDTPVSMRIDQNELSNALRRRFGGQSQLETIGDSSDSEN